MSKEKPVAPATVDDPGPAGPPPPTTERADAATTTTTTTTESAGASGSTEPVEEPGDPIAAAVADIRIALQYRQGSGDVGLPTRDLTVAEVWLRVGNQARLERISGPELTKPYARTPDCPTLPPYQRRSG